MYELTEVLLLRIQIPQVDSSIPYLGILPASLPY